MDKRSKHTQKERQQAVRLFRDGHGAVFVANRLGIPKQTVRQWSIKYATFGSKGVLNVGKKYTVYSYELKLRAVQAVVDEGKSRSQVMKEFRIVSVAPLDRWCRQYRQGGADALLPKPKGRRPGTPNKPKILTREEELQERINYLEMENAILKKFHALAVQEEYLDIISRKS